MPELDVGVEWAALGGEDNLYLLQKWGAVRRPRTEGAALDDHGTVRDTHLQEGNAMATKGQLCVHACVRGYLPRPFGPLLWPLLWLVQPEPCPRVGMK